MIGLRSIRLITPAPCPSSNEHLRLQVRYTAWTFRLILTDRLYFRLIWTGHDFNLSQPKMCQSVCSVTGSLENRYGISGTMSLRSINGFRLEDGAFLGSALPLKHKVGPVSGFKNSRLINTYHVSCSKLG